jgi:hypothetical protein
MTVNLHHSTWLSKILQLRPDERITRVRNMAWLLVGIFQSKSVHLSKIAGRIPGEATLNSVTRRLDRFLENSAVQVRDWYDPVAKWLLSRACGLEVRLIVDGSKVGFGHQLLVVALAYHRRAIPLVWTWVKSKRGHSSTSKQLALLSHVRRLLSPGVKVLLVGDAEFGGVGVLRQLDEWRWEYVLRQKGSDLVKAEGARCWKSFDSLIQKAGQMVWMTGMQLTRLHAYPTNLLAYWKEGEKEPWFLAASLPAHRSALRAYERRMWIEEMFGDMKENGFDLESTRLREVVKLSRLTLAVVLLYVDLIALGARAIKAGQRRLVDRADRRDLSVFRIGLYSRERHLTNSTPFKISFCLCR